MSAFETLLFVMGKISCFMLFVNIAFYGGFGLPYDSNNDAKVQDERYEHIPSDEEEAMDEDEDEVTYEDVLNKLANM